MKTSGHTIKNVTIALVLAAASLYAQAGGTPTVDPRGPRGITIAGEVKTFTPVTDEMLRNPPPGDWLMIRRDYKASNFSPLNQINAANVKNLKLVWSWAMAEGGTNQPAPIVHGDRDRDLGRGDDVNRRRVLFKHPEELVQEPVRHQHPGGRDIHDGDVAF